MCPLDKSMLLRCSEVAGCKGADLCIELDVGGAKADEASEEGLVQVAIFLEGHVLHNRGQLVVVSYQDHTLQPAVAILLPLQPYKLWIQW